MTDWIFASILQALDIVSDFDQVRNEIEDLKKALIDMDHI